MHNPDTHNCRWRSWLYLFAFLFAGYLAMTPATYAGTSPKGRQIIVEPAEPLDVVAWVNHVDNTYVLGEEIRLSVQTNKDAYLLVLYTDSSGKSMVLFPKAKQPEIKVEANRIVKFPPPGVNMKAGHPIGKDVIKVIASTKPLPPLATLLLAGTSQSDLAKMVAKMFTLYTDREWDDYDKAITVIPKRTGEAVTWPEQPFGLRIATNKPMYRIGEQVSIYVQANAPCWLTLVNIGSSGQTRVILPNAAQLHNRLPAEQTMVFPVASSNLRLMPRGPEGVETVLAICTTDNQPVLPVDPSSGRTSFVALDARDLELVMAPNPNRQVARVLTSFIVTQ